LISSGVIDLATSNAAPTGTSFLQLSMKVVRRSNANPLLALNFRFQLTMKVMEPYVERCPGDWYQLFVSRTRLRISGLARLDRIG
jgi:hypothetical protein